MPVDSIVADLLRQRPDQQQAAEFERFLVDAYTGGGGFRGRIKRPDLSPEGIAYSGVPGCSTYLDQFGRENDTKFSRRIACSHYTNYCRPTTNLKVSYLLRKGWRYTDEPEQITEWRKRTRFDATLSKRAQLACVLGYVPVVTDLPATPEDAKSAAESPKQEPYTTALLPIQVLDWDVDEDGEPTFVKYATRTEERVSWRESVPTIVTRVSIWTRTEFEVWLVRQGSGGESAEQVGGGTHKAGRVPVSFWKAAENVDDPVRGDSVMADVAILNRRVFNIESEQMEHVRGQVFAVLLLPRRDIPQGDTETDEAYAERTGLAVGVENGLVYDADQPNAPAFIAPPGDVAKTYKELRNDAVIELCRVARVEFERASGTESSAQSKQQNFEPTNLAVADIAKSMSHGIRDTLVTVGRLLGVSEDKLEAFQVTPHESYATDDLHADVEVAQTLLADPAFGETFNAALRKQIVRAFMPHLGSEALALIDAEIDEKVAEAEVERKASIERTAEGEKTATDAIKATLEGDGEPDEDDAAAAE